MATALCALQHAARAPRGGEVLQSCARGELQPCRTRPGILQVRNRHHRDCCEPALLVLLGAGLLPACVAHTQGGLRAHELA